MELDRLWNEGVRNSMQRRLMDSSGRFTVRVCVWGDSVGLVRVWRDSASLGECECGGCWQRRSPCMEWLLQVTLPGLLAVADATNVLRYAYRRTYVPSLTDELSPGGVGPVLMESSVEAQAKDHSVDVGALPNPRSFRFRDSPRGDDAGIGAGSAGVAVVPGAHNAVSRRNQFKRQYTTPAALGQSSATLKTRRRRSGAAVDVPGEPWHLIRPTPEAAPPAVDGGTPRPPLERGNSTDSASAGVAAAARDAAAQRTTPSLPLTPAVAPLNLQRDAPAPALPSPLPTGAQPSVAARSSASDMIQQARAAAEAVMAASGGGSDDTASARAGGAGTPSESKAHSDGTIRQPETPVAVSTPRASPGPASPAKDGGGVRGAVLATPSESVASSAAPSPLPGGGAPTPSAITGAGLLVLQVAGPPPNSPGANFVDSADPTQIADHSRFAALLYGTDGTDTGDATGAAGVDAGSDSKDEDAGGSEGGPAS